MSDLFQQPFRFYMKKHSRAFTLGVISLLFTNFFDVLTPLGLKLGIDAITGKDQPGLLRAILIFVGLMMGVTLFRYLWRIYFGRFNHAVADDLRQRLFNKMTELGPSFYQKNPTGQLMSLITNDVNTFRMAIGPGSLILLDALFLILMILPVMVSLSPDWTWKTLILLPLVPFFMRRMEALIHTLYRFQQDRLADVSARAAEIVSGIRVIKGFAQEKNQLGSFNSESKKFELACNEMAKVDAAFQPVMEFAVASGSVILLWLCTPPVMRGTVTLGTFVAFHEYIKRMTWPMSAIGMGISMYEQGRASFDRIREVLMTETDIPDLGTQTVDAFESLEVRQLSYRHSGAPLDTLKNIQFKIEQGETVGLVGPVGSGKTTLLQLISRLHPLQSGEILINGIPIETIKRSSLAKLISVVPQDAFLFSDSVAANIGFGFDQLPPLEFIEEAARQVNMEREIRELPLKYQTFLGERGVNLSGGQKQRLTIARAMIRKTPVVLLDDSLSAVDANTERAIVAELKATRNDQVENAAKQTVLIVSHRLATLKHADRIIVFLRGEIEAIGAHEELLRTSPTYRRLHELQASPQNMQVSSSPLDQDLELAAASQAAPAVDITERQSLAPLEDHV
jgi:ATP-binding cassette subfamily B multidrug efflux pump